VPEQVLSAPSVSDLNIPKLKLTQGKAACTWCGFDFVLAYPGVVQEEFILGKTPSFCFLLGEVSEALGFDFH